MKFQVGDMVHWHNDKDDIGFIIKIGHVSYNSEISILVHWFNNSEVSEFRSTTAFLHLCT